MSTESFDDQVSTLRAMCEWPHVLRTSAKERAAIAMAVRVLESIGESPSPFSTPFTNPASSMGILK